LISSDRCRVCKKNWPLAHTGYALNAILNIVNNSIQALDFLNSEKLIKISTILDDNDIKIIISDNAGGIPSEIIDKIFAPYFTTKPKGVGTGLGLSICKNIIESSLHGKISVHNSEVGAVFIITIPKQLEENNDT